MTTRAVEVPGPRHLLTRLLDTPNLARVVQALEPRVLHQLVRHCGLEDCGEIISLATTDQLTHIFDDDLWRNDRSGEEEQFDADRFGLWLEVLAEVGVDVAAQKLVEMDFDLVTAALSRHLLVLDQESLIFGQAAADPDRDDFDPIENARAVLAENALEDGLSYDIGGFMVIAKRGASWDALLSILVHLQDDHRGFVGKLMTRCAQLSTEYINDNGGLYEVLTADQQVVADVAGERERRRQQEGYVTPAQALAWLKLARRRQDPAGSSAPGWDPVTVGYFKHLEHHARAAPEREVTDFLSTLMEGGVIEPQRPPLLLKGEAADETRLSRIRSQLRFVQEHDGDAYARRTEELAYLANVLIAGCSFQSRRFRAVEAADAVLAVCNLGLENGLPAEFLLRQDLVTVFRTGWSVIYNDVCLYVAQRLTEILSELKCEDDDLHGQLRQLSRRMKRQLDAGTPWRERDQLDVIAVLDQPSWAILQGLVDECPVVPKAAETAADGRRPLRMTSEFEFISEHSQVLWVRDLVESLPGRLPER